MLKQNYQNALRLLLHPLLFSRTGINILKAFYTLDFVQIIHMKTNILQLADGAGGSSHRRQMSRCEKATIILDLTNFRTANKRTIQDVTSRLPGNNSNNNV